MHSAKVLILLILPISSIQLGNNIAENGPFWPEGNWALPSSFPEIEDNLIGPSCKRHFNQYIGDLQSMRLWALQMYDATGKVGSGLLRGNSAQLGNYDECVSVSEPEKDIKGQYCLASVFVNARNTSPEAIRNVLELVTSYRAFHSTPDDMNIKISPSFSELLWGLCVPSSCSSNDVKNILSQTLNKYNSTENGLDIKLELKPSSCKIQDLNEPLTKPFIYALSIFAVLLAVTTYATISDYNSIWRGSSVTQNQSSDSRAEQIVKSFSLYRTIPDLLNTTIGDDITCVHGIRFVFSMMIFLIHKVVFNLLVPAVNRTVIAESLESSWTMIFRAFWGGVDAFVLISGLLTSYFSIKKLKNGGKLNILFMYFQRYVKFTPLFYMTVVTLRILNYIMVDSPMKIHVSSHFLDKCETTWKTLLYISNVDSLNEMCYPPSHQLITDMQMYMLAPFIVLAMWKWRKTSLYAITLSIMLLTLYKGLAIYRGNLLSVVHYGAPNNKIVESGDQLYINPIHRLTPYLFGIALGYILQMYKKEDLRLSTEYLNIGSGLAVVSAYYSFFALSAASKRGYEYSAVTSALYGMAQPILWSLALGWTIFVCHTGQAEFLNKIASWKGFIIFSRIAYPFYMVQIIVIFYWMNSLYEPQRLSPHFVFDLNEIVTLMVITLLYTQLFLLPIKGIMAAIRRRPKSLKFEKEVEVTEPIYKYEAEKIKLPELFEKRRKNTDVDILKLLAEVVPDNETLLF